jgi:MarR family transcriptional regulator for hemolysin
MQPFHKSTYDHSPKAARFAEDVARAVLETIPVVMQVIRETMRSQRAVELTVPQFRVLALIFHHADVSLSELAEHVGIGLPSASKLIDGLVARGMILRTEAQDDRRRKEMRVTPTGRATFEKIQERARVALARQLAGLPAADAASIASAMGQLRRQLGPPAINGTHKSRTRAGAPRSNGHHRSSQV